MRETEEKQQSFRNGKELLEHCIRTLNANQRGESGGNVALYPVLVIMLGEKCAEHVKYIKRTLDDNWNNARFLKYLKVVKQGDTWQASLIDSSEDYEQCEWESETAEFQEAMNKAVVEMLEADEKIFLERNSVKMEYVLDATEEEGREYFFKTVKEFEKMIAKDELIEYARYVDNYYWDSARLCGGAVGNWQGRDPGDRDPGCPQG